MSKCNRRDHSVCFMLLLRFGFNLNFLLRCDRSHGRCFSSCHRGFSMELVGRSGGQLLGLCREHHGRLHTWFAQSCMHHVLTKPFDFCDFSKKKIIYFLSGGFYCFFLFYYYPFLATGLVESSGKMVLLLEIIQQCCLMGLYRYH